MSDMIHNPSNSFFGDLKGFFTGASANTSYSGGDASNPLIALGLSREAAQYYANEYSQGNPVLVVNAQGREQEVLDILSRYGAYNAQIKSTDEVQPLANIEQKKSYEMSVPLNDTQSWESYSQPQTAQGASFAERQRDTEPFGVLQNAPIANSDDDQVLQVDENTIANSWYPDASFSESTPASDLSQPDASDPAQEEETPTASTSADAAENGAEELDTSEVQADRDAFENGVEELATSEFQADRDAPDQEDEPLEKQDNIDMFEDSVDELNISEVPQEKATPVMQDSIDAVENSDEKFSTPVIEAEEQASVDAAENDIEEFDTSEVQPDMHSYQMPTVATDVATQTTDAEPSSQSTIASEQAEELELQQLQEEIKLMQQQLQSAKTSLDAIKERERQYRKRQKQLQNTKKQLQNLQEELQATQAELQETVMRVTSYQNSEIEPVTKQPEKQKKAKKQKKSAAFSFPE